MAVGEPESHLREAIRLATENVIRGRGGPFGAVIVRGDRVIARGVNEVTSSNDPTAHAEILAIRRACAQLGTFRLDGCVVYCSCEPCPMCMGALYWARPETEDRQLVFDYFVGRKRLDGIIAVGIEPSAHELADEVAAGARSSRAPGSACAFPTT